MVTKVLFYHFWRTSSFPVIPSNKISSNHSPRLPKWITGSFHVIFIYSKTHPTSAQVRARFHGRLELDMRVQPALQHALLEYRFCRDWRDWRPNWISFSTQPIACLHGNKVTAFLFCPPFCPRFPPVQASHGNALLGACHMCLLSLQIYCSFLVI
jgi:hypothetical protein